MSRSNPPEVQVQPIEFLRSSIVAGLASAVTSQEGSSRPGFESITGAPAAGNTTVSRIR
jgi:hypothetical protein